MYMTFNIGLFQHGVFFVLFSSVLCSTYHIHSFKQSLTHKNVLGAVAINNDATTLRPCNVEKNSLHLVLWGGYAKLAFPYSANDFIFPFSFITYFLCSLGSLGG